MSLSVIFNHFPLRVLSHQPIWGLELFLPPARCACVCFHSHLHSTASKSVHVMRVHALSVPYPPFIASWLSKLILLWDFLVICKSAVTVMRAAQRRWQRGKCQHVSEEWHRTSELSTWGPSDSTQHTHDKAKLVPTRIIPAHVLNRDSCELIHARSKYKNGRPKNTFCQQRC